MDTFQVFQHASYNRTTEELKLDNDTTMKPVDKAYNRTTEELKLYL